MRSRCRQEFLIFHARFRQHASGAEPNRIINDASPACLRSSRPLLIARIDRSWAFLMLTLLRAPRNSLSSVSRTPPSSPYIRWPAPDDARPSLRHFVPEFLCCAVSTLNRIQPQAPAFLAGEIRLTQVGPKRIAHGGAFRYREDSAGICRCRRVDRLSEFNSRWCGSIGPQIMHGLGKGWPRHRSITERYGSSAATAPRNPRR